MTSLAQLNGTTMFDTVRAACDAMVKGSDNVVSIPTSVVGANGFGLIDTGTGSQTITGVVQPDGSLPVIVAMGSSERLTYGKGEFNIESCTKALLQNLTITGAAVSSSDGNGAGVRVNATCPDWTMRNLRVLACQDGLLTDGDANQIGLIEDCLFDNDGFGRQGFTHDGYLGLAKQITVRRSSFTNSQYGHDLKSRSLALRLEQVHCEGSAHGREVDFSNGGIFYAEDSVFIKHGDNRDQNNLIHLAPEGIPDGRPEKYDFVRCRLEIQIDPSSGRALEFVRYDGKEPVNFLDTEIILNGVTLNETTVAKFMPCPYKFTTTPGVKPGPAKPTGRAETTAVAPAPVVNTPVPAPVPTAPAAPAPTSAAQPLGSWVKLGMERETISIPAGASLRYGDSTVGKYVMKNVVAAQTVLISNDFFGSDPAPGIQKTVEQFVIPVAPAAPPAPLPSAAQLIGFFGFTQDTRLILDIKVGPTPSLTIH